MALIPLTFALALVIGGIAAPIVTGDSDLWIGTVVAILLAAGLVVADRVANRSRSGEERDQDRAMGVPPR